MLKMLRKLGGMLRGGAHPLEIGLSAALGVLALMRLRAGSPKEDRPR